MIYTLICRRCGGQFESKSPNSLFCNGQEGNEDVSCQKLQRIESKKRGQDRRKKFEEACMRGKYVLTFKGFELTEHFISRFEFQLKEKLEISSEEKFRVWKYNNVEKYVEKYEEFKRNNGVDTL